VDSPGIETEPRPWKVGGPNILLYETIDKVRKPGIVNHHGHVTSNGGMVKTGSLN
jgi:hypothetical protein